MNGLSRERCVPCEGGVPPLTDVEVRALWPQIGDDWKLVEGKLVRVFKFKAFESALDFVNRVGTIAGQENHHPDIEINYDKVTLSLITHAIKGLSKNDFILAAKINEIIET